MTDRDGFPEDVLIAAADVMAAVQGNVEKFEGWEWPITVRLVAKALLAERERCARIVEEYHPEKQPWDGYEFMAAVDNAVIDLAAAIRTNAPIVVGV